MVGAFNNNVTFVTCHDSICFKNIGLEGAFSSTEGALYQHCLPYTLKNTNCDTRNLSQFSLFTIYSKLLKSSKRMLFI